MEFQVAKNTFNCQSLSVNLLGNSVGIKQLLQQQIFAALALSTGNTTAVNFLSNTAVTPQAIPLHRLSEDECLLYRCAIALKLSPLWQLNALDIAHQLTASFPDISPDTAEQRCIDFSVEVVSPGWIDFRLSDRGLAAWLQQLIQIPPPGETVSRGQLSPLTPSLLFSVQYVHARCCSLLRLAHWQGLIQLSDIDFQTLKWQLIEPNPIPWLNDDQETDIGHIPLRLVHPAERGLIAQLLDVQDEISSPGHLKWVKRANALSHAFEQFYSSCRIWGEVKSHTPKLAQARLGLLGVTQVCLRSLLQDQMGVTAPVEL